MLAALALAACTAPAGDSAPPRSWLDAVLHGDYGMPRAEQSAAMNQALDPHR